MKTLFLSVSLLWFVQAGIPPPLEDPAAHSSVELALSVVSKVGQLCGIEEPCRRDVNRRRQGGGLEGVLIVRPLRDGPITIINAFAPPQGSAELGRGLMVEIGPQGTIIEKGAFNQRAEADLNRPDPIDWAATAGVLRKVIRVLDLLQVQEDKVRPKI